MPGGKERERERAELSKQRTKSGKRFLLSAARDNHTGFVRAREGKRPRRATGGGREIKGGWGRKGVKKGGGQVKGVGVLKG